MHHQWCNSTDMLTHTKMPQGNGTTLNVGAADGTGFDSRRFHSGAPATDPGNSPWSVAGLPPRLASKIDATPTCWLWTGHRDRYGYGKVRVAPGTTGVRGAHRVLFEALVGPIPDGLTLDHLCRVRHCVNPAHLEPVPNRVNVLRGESPNAENARKTHCIRGHELAGENLGVYADGHRKCRTCRTAASRARRTVSR